MKPSKCSNCDEIIPKLEKKAMLRCKVVCQKCFYRNKKKRRYPRNSLLREKWFEFQNKKE